MRNTNKQEIILKSRIFLEALFSSRIVNAQFQWLHFAFY